jgi:trans-aconitate methyltransferase
MSKDAFLTVHQQMDRQGPGSADDVIWAAEAVGLSQSARVCDAACGPGADTQTLLSLLPQGQVTAVDKYRHFVDELLVRIGDEPRLTAYAGDMAKLKGPFDLIWCAGAVYFLGIGPALTAWRPCLAKGGAVAFSEPCFFTEAPSERARAYWGGYDTGSEAAIRAQVAGAGFEVLATRRVSDAGWAAYHATLGARLDALRGTDDPALQQVIAASDQEIADWQEIKHETGYLLLVVRPV